MALPPNGDPRRPLYLAIRSTRLLGVLFVLLGLLTPLPTLRLNPHLLELPGPVIASTLIHLLPGLLYLLCAALLKQGRRPALIASLGLVAVHCVMVAGSLAAFSTLLVSQEEVSFFLFFGLGVMVFSMAALGQLFYHLTKSFKAITYPPLGVPLDASANVGSPPARQAA
jgi:hypothetical protein